MVPLPPHPSPFLYAPSRQTQPYRPEGGRLPGLTLAAMLAGRTLYGQNPMDQRRQVQKRRPDTGGLVQLLSRLDGF